MNSFFGDHGGWKEMNNTKLMAIAMLAVVGAMVALGLGLAAMARRRRANKD
jgi:hypothetical protein